jgi:putative peptidoglycan lipid II flippase
MTVPTINERTPPSAGVVLAQQQPAAEVVRSAGIVSAAVLFSRLSGLVREIVMADRFGAGFAHDAFLLGFRISNLSRDLFAEGALSSAFVPTFTHSLMRQDKRHAAELANLVTTAILVIVGAVCLLGMWQAPHLVGLLAPGFASTPAKFALAVRLTRIMFPFLLLIALAAQASGMLNTHGSFGMPAVGSIFFNIGSVGFGLLIGYVIGPHVGVTPIEGMAYGIVVGGALQLGWQRAKLHRLGYRFRLVWSWSHPGLRRIAGMMLPALVGSLAGQANLIINTSFASQLIDPIRGHDGPVSWLGYAMRFVQVPLSLFGVAFASALLPSIARSAAANNFDEFRKTMVRSLGMVFLLTIPTSVLLIVLGHPLIGAVYQSGRFNSYDTAQTGLALSCYATGLVAFSSQRVLIPAFYALADARTPMLISLSSIALNVAIPLLLLRVWHIGFEALAITTAVAVGVECLCLAECLRRKLDGFEAQKARSCRETVPGIGAAATGASYAGNLESRYLRGCFLRIALASAIMALSVVFVRSLVVSAFPQTRWGDLSELALFVPLALGTFLIAARALDVEEIRFAYESFVVPTWRRVRRLHAKIAIG